MGQAFAGALGELSAPGMAFALATVFAAAVLRGFTGFGFALLAVPALTLVLPPAEAVPCSLIVQWLAGANLLPKVWRSVDWPSVKPLLAGAVAGTPFGIAALAALPADPMRAAIGVIVLGVVALLWRGFKLKGLPPAPLPLGLGALSGLLNGATAMGGPPVIVLYLALPNGVAVGRASLMAFFFFSSAVTIAMTAAAGVVTWRVVALSALMLPATFLGNALGDRGFDRASAALYRRVALVVLFAIGAVALGRALLGLAGWA